VVEFIRQGLEAGEKVLYLGDERGAQDSLRAARIEPDDYLERGQLELRPATEAYLAGGEFDPDRMIATLRREAQAATAAGHAALRVTGEMGWAVGGAPGAELLPEYERQVNVLLPEINAVALCQYDRRRFSAEALNVATAVHPKTIDATVI
jgi:hypothetical protein